jgi:hypothetical protein
MPAGNGEVVVVGDETALLQQQAVSLDVRVAEVDVAARDRDLLVGPADPDTGDPSEIEVLRLQPRRQQPLRDRRRRLAEARPVTRATATRQQRERDSRECDPQGDSTTFVASRESNRR